MKYTFSSFMYSVIRIVLQKINQQFLKNVGIKSEKSWMFERFITVGYYALVDFTKVTPVPDIISDACEWFSIYDIPEMILDHRHIFDEALQNLRMQLNFHPLVLIFWQKNLQCLNCKNCMRRYLVRN